MPSPPKPWERAGTGTAVTSTYDAATTAGFNAAANVAASNESGRPAVPTRPNSLTSYANRPGYSNYSSPYSRFGSSYGNNYGSYASPYSSHGSYGYGSYNSPYSRFGNSYGSYSGYGGYGAYNRPLGGPMGPGGPDEFSMTQRMEQGTRGAFEILESIVGAFGGFAQMLESTFMATHSSFMAMVGVAEQFGNLRNYLGQVLSIFALIRWTKDLVRRVFGLKPEGRPGEINPAEFGVFEEQKKFSRKPLLIFLFVVFGIPYLMHKFVQVVSRKQETLQGPDGQPLSSDATAESRVIDPKNLEFARALYDFAAESPMELSFRRGEIIAILDKRDPSTGGPSQWWRGRLRNGEMGMFPCNYVEIIVKGGTAGNWAGATTPSAPVPEISVDEFAKKAA